MAKHPDPNMYTLQTSHTAHEAKLLYRIFIQVRTTVLTPIVGHEAVSRKVKLLVVMVKHPVGNR